VRARRFQKWPRGPHANRARTADALWSRARARLSRVPRASCCALFNRGVWQLPGSAEFHVAWTGVAEIAGGAGLLIGAAADALGFARLRWLKPSSAACLAALTLAVTPANVYMYTHGAMMDGLPGPPVDGPIPVSAHFARFALQAVLLALLAGMARDASSGPVDDELSA